MGLRGNVVPIQVKRDGDMKEMARLIDSEFEALHITAS